jgi:predicted  nucleic acid-binding Zn-ribbon protein
MKQIQILETEISTLQTEISKLQQQHTQLSQNFSPVICGNNASELLESIENATTEASSRRQQMQVIQEAITILTPQLKQKQAQLAGFRKQQRRQELEEKRTELQPQLLELTHEINELSSRMDAACAQYRQMALQYNQMSSELEEQQVFPVSMNVSSVPYATTITGREFNLKLGMRNLGSAIAFEQPPKPYVPSSPNYSTPIGTRIAILKGSLAELKNYRQSVPDWDLARVAVAEGQIAETQRQLRELEQQQEAAV